MVREITHPTVFGSVHPVKPTQIESPSMPTFQYVPETTRSRGHQAHSDADPTHLSRLHSGRVGGDCRAGDELCHTHPDPDLGGSGNRRGLANLGPCGQAPRGLIAIPRLDSFCTRRKPPQTRLRGRKRRFPRLSVPRRPQIPTYPQQNPARYQQVIPVKISCCAAFFLPESVGRATVRSPQRSFGRPGGAQRLRRLAQGGTDP